MDFYQTSPPQSSTNKIWVYSTGNHYYNKKTRIVTNSSQWRTAVVNYATISSKLFLKLHLNSYTFCDYLEVIQ